MEFGVIRVSHSVSHLNTAAFRCSPPPPASRLGLLPHTSSGRQTGAMVTALHLLLCLPPRSAAVSQVTQPGNDIIPVSTHTCFLKSTTSLCLHTPPPPAPMHFLDLLKGQHPSGATGEPPCCSNIRLRWSHQSHILICDIDILCLLKASSPLCLLWCSADVRGGPQKKKLKLLLNHD